MVIRIANRILNARVLELIELNNDVNIEKIKITSKFNGKTIVQSQIRKSLKLNIIALER